MENGKELKNFFYISNMCNYFYFGFEYLNKIS